MEERGGGGLAKRVVGGRGVVIGRKDELGGRGDGSLERRRVVWREGGWFGEKEGGLERRGVVWREGG